MRHLQILVILICFTVSVVAQDVPDESWTFPTGTTIHYPATWTFDPRDDLVMLIQENRTGYILVADYPLVSNLIGAAPLTLQSALEAVNRELLKQEMNPLDIVYFDIQGRAAARYDVPGTAGIQTSLIALTFTNGSTGLLVTANIPELILQPILDSFDNRVVLDQSMSGDPPSLMWFFPDAGFFAYPQDWLTVVRNSPGLELDYVTVMPPVRDAAYVLFDLSGIVRDSTQLTDVLEPLRTILLDELGIEYDESRMSYPTIGTRRMLRYPATITTPERSYRGQLTLLRFAEHGTGMIVSYGNTGTYPEATLLIFGSFDNRQAILNLQD